MRLLAQRLGRESAQFALLGKGKERSRGRFAQGTPSCVGSGGDEGGAEGGTPRELCVVAGGVDVSQARRHPCLSRLSLLDDVGSLISPHL